MKCIKAATLAIALSMSIPVMAQMAGQTGNGYFVTGIEKR